MRADLETPRRLVNESRDYLVGEFGEPEPGWLAAMPRAGEVGATV